MRYLFLRFPEGKIKALTFSYDDGVKADIRLASIFDRYGLKGTFNINSDYIGADAGRLTEEEIRTHLLDAGHEIAVHGARHIAPGAAVPSVAIEDILRCRRELETRFDRLVRGMAYPDSGVKRLHGANTYEDVRSYVRSLGISYARTLGGDNDGFALPCDLYAWMPTAHHNNPALFDYAARFLAVDESNLYSSSRYPRLFYLWGHSYEFDRDGNWDRIERFCEEMSGKSDVYYGTNGDVADYVTAFSRLVASADGTRLYNPTARTLWVDADGALYRIAPDETVRTD